ncbi:hypothetical protein BGX28_010089, partial [Mortierella sp. GBA30]
LSLVMAVPPMVVLASSPDFSGYSEAAGLGFYDSVGSGISPESDTGGHCSADVPVGPVSIVPEMDFIPINNVWPIVNVHPTSVKNYCDYANEIYQGDGRLGGYDGM